jgi:hypothetical protein
MSETVRLRPCVSDGSTTSRQCWSSSLFGLDTAVTLLYQALPEAKREGGVNWPGKSGVTFSDALMAVRRWLWREWVFPQVGVAPVVQKLPEPVQDLLLYGLAPAA